MLKLSSRNLTRKGQLAIKLAVVGARPDTKPASPLIVLLFHYTIYRLFVNSFATKKQKVLEIVVSRCGTGGYVGGAAPQVVNRWGIST